jgi:hypothetical protein
MDRQALSVPYNGNIYNVEIEMIYEGVDLRMTAYTEGQTVTFEYNADHELQAKPGSSLDSGLIEQICWRLAKTDF